MSTTYRTAPTTEAREALAAKHLGIIAERCLSYYKSVPESAKRYYDVEDMIGETVVQVVRYSHRYSPGVAKESTWVYTVANNYCKTILSRFRTHRLSGCETVSISDELARTFRAEDRMERRDAFEAVERVIEFGSDAVLDLIEDILEGNPVSRSETLEELRRTMKRVNATVEDLALVIRYAS